MSARQASNLAYQRLATYLMNTRDATESEYYRRFILALFQRAAKETCLWPQQARESGEIDTPYASVIGVIDPSDGHPQEEHTPDFGWFRPLAHNNQTWVLYWPELEV